MEKPKKPISTVDEYVAGLPQDCRPVMEQFRLLMKKIAPGAKEKISYGMPGWDENGLLVWFAAWKTHYGFYPSAEPIKVFADRISDYKTSKGCIQFPAGEKLPVKLITDIVKFRQKSIAEAKAKKTAGRKVTKK